MSGYDGPFIATAFVLGLVIVGAALEIERRREKNPLPVLVPTMPFILLGAAIVIASRARPWRQVQRALDDT
jgi:hypothetical protein